MRRLIKYSIWSFTLVFTLVIAAVVIMSIGTKSNEANSTILNLDDSTHEELVDFLYEFSQTHRLNIQWFGWYKEGKKDAWFIRPDRDPNFKLGMFMLTEENGYLLFSNRFNDLSKANFSIDYGPRKADWLNIISEMERQLEERGWLVRE